MDAVTSAQLVAGRGIVGNANQGGKRQVTLMAPELWNDSPPSWERRTPARDERTSSCRTSFSRNSRGKTLRVGTVRIRIYGETRPCDKMDDAMPRIRAALGVPWGGGAFGEVWTTGAITIGDPADWDVVTGHRRESQRRL